MRQFYQGAVYYALVSIIFISFTFRKKEWVLLVPIVALVFGVFFYYAFIYSSDDFISSSRYIMHILLGLYYLGAAGFERFIAGINQQKGYMPLKFIGIVVWVGLFVCALWA